MILEVARLTKRFGGLTAVDGISFRAASGQITSVIGPNGAGKTTLLNMISGVSSRDEGTVTLDGRAPSGTTPRAMALLGVARTYQAPQLFAGMTVLETVMVGAHLTGKGGFLSALFDIRGTQRQELVLERRACDALAHVGLGPELYDRHANELAYGLQRRVEIARALAMEPKVLLLDEPAAGLNDAETRELSTLVRELASGGLLVVLVEHDMEMVMSISDRIVVMNFGSKIAEGTPAEIQSHPAVIEAYLGVDGEPAMQEDRHARAA